MVAGKWDESNPVIVGAARDLGAWAAVSGHQVLTGGGSGVPQYAHEGACAAGGPTYAFVPTTREHDPDPAVHRSYTLAVYTDTGWDGRSSIAVKSSDVLVVLGGSNGTLNEITCAYLNRVPVLVLEGSSDLVVRLRSFLVDRDYIDDRKNVAIRILPNLAAVTSAIEELALSSGVM
jgi:uncharacterized protein (TIGR00725 family)